LTKTKNKHYSKSENGEEKKEKKKRSEEENQISGRRNLYNKEKEKGPKNIRMIERLFF